MMNVILIIVLAVAFSASLAPAILSVIELFLKRSAENRFKEILLINIFMNGMTDMISSDLSTDPPDPEKVAVAREYFEQVLKNLDERYQKEIEAGLSQPSLKGQRDYMAKFIAQIGTKADLKLISPK